ncbi:MAG: hypothetical protein H7X95_08185, partial [Deltaproteobacteria bacterium]|nr:hypothetical protein [Deltaproteobacteria bacterium]
MRTTRRIGRDESQLGLALMAALIVVGGCAEDAKPFGGGGLSDGGLGRTGGRGGSAANDGSGGNLGSGGVSADAGPLGSGGNDGSGDGS